MLLAPLSNESHSSPPMACRAPCRCKVGCMPLAVFQRNQFAFGCYKWLESGLESHPPAASPRGLCSCCRTISLRFNPLEDNRQCRQSRDRRSDYNECAP
jgi:hypothetical protein